MNQPPEPVSLSNETLDQIANQIRYISAENQRLGQATIVGIAGGSSTGKSTQVAIGLLDRLRPDAQLISQDNYQLGRDYDLTTDPMYRHDGLGNYGLTESAALLTSLRHGRSATMPVYAFLEQQQTGHQLIQPTPIVLFDGLYAGFGPLRTQCDWLIYVESPLYGRLLRRLFRNRYERYRLEPSVSLRNTLAGGVLPAHHDLVCQQRATADIILQNPYAFTESIIRFDLPILQRTYQLDNVAFSFHFGTNSEWRVETELPSANGSIVRHVGLFQQNERYASFPIDDDTLLRLVALDLNSW